jgi:hypothetical protein
VSSPIWGSWPDIYYCLTVTVLFLWGALSDERAGLSFIYAAGPCQCSFSRVKCLGTRDHILLSPIWDFLSCNCLEFCHSLIQPRNGHGSTVNTYHVIALQPVYWRVGRIYRKHSFLLLLRVGPCNALIKSVTIRMQCHEDVRSCEYRPLTLDQIEMSDHFHAPAALYVGRMSRRMFVRWIRGWM